MKGADVREKFVELRAAGQSYAEIARQLNVSKPTLIQWAKEMEIELSNARALRLDELYSRLALAKEKRLEAFGARYQAVMTELDRRDLGEIPTPALLALALKWDAHIREEIQAPLLRKRTSDVGFDLTTEERFPA